MYASIIQMTYIYTCMRMYVCHLDDFLFFKKNNNLLELAFSRCFFFSRRDWHWHARGGARTDGTGQRDMAMSWRYTPRKSPHRLRPATPTSHHVLLGARHPLLPVRARVKLSGAGCCCGSTVPGCGTRLHHLLSIIAYQFSPARRPPFRTAPQASEIDRPSVAVSTLLYMYWVQSYTVLYSVATRTPRHATPRTHRMLLPALVAGIKVVVQLLLLCTDDISYRI